jgi:hypothetical protein
VAQDAPNTTHMQTGFTLSVRHIARVVKRPLMDEGVKFLTVERHAKKSS